MATIPLPERPDIDQLRKQARELQRASRRADPDAARLVREHHPDQPDAGRLTLQAAQLVIARRYRFASWNRLQRHVGVLSERTWSPQQERAGEGNADRFLRLACLTFSDADSPARRAQAAALLSDHPELVSEQLAVAAACADFASVRRLLARNPESVHEHTGPYDWSPLLYAAYARHDPRVTADAVRRTVELLLEAGADPNDGCFWNGLPTPFTVLGGIFASADELRPAHPHAVAFARVLLAAGAEANDGQVLYNRMFADNDDFLPVLFEFGLGIGDGGPWHDLLGDTSDTPEQMVRSLLQWAIDHDQRSRVALLLEYGVDGVSPLRLGRRQALSGRTPLARAMLSGHLDVAELLRHGDAANAGGGLDPADLLIAALMRGDAVPGAAPEVLTIARSRRPGLAVWAAGLGKPDAVLAVLAAGWPVDALGRADTPIEQEWETALHVAAGDGDPGMVRQLLELGARRNIADKRFGATAAGWAEHFGHYDLMQLLR